MPRRRDRIRVKVIKRTGKLNYAFRWKDPITNRWRERVSEIEATRSNRRRAEREAADLEKELAGEGESVTWPAFCKRYSEEHLASLAVNTRRAWATANAHFERIVNPQFVGDIDASTLSYFASKLRTGKKAVRETSIASYLGHIEAALSWAVDPGGIIDVAPKLKQPKRSKGQEPEIRLRTITGEELDRLVAKVDEDAPEGVDGWPSEKDRKIWKFTLRGLDLSGLRLGEAVRLSWDWTADFSICLKDRHPMYRIYAEGEKGHSDRLLPLTPDFARFLMAVPEEQRKGRVFKLGLGASRIGRTISNLGEAAKILVDRNGKFASAHDLRRAFLTRWAALVMPATLQLLARHRSIETTMKYYVRQNARNVAAELWKVQKGVDSGELASQGVQNQVVKEPT